MSAREVLSEHELSRLRRFLQITAEDLIRFFMLAGPDVLRGQSRLVDLSCPARISPARSEHIDLFGTITVDLDAEPALRGPKGHRQLRSPAAQAWS